MKLKIILLSLALSIGIAPAAGSASASPTSTAWKNGVPAPMNRIAPALQRMFTCIILHESTSTWRHPNLGDNNRYGSSGVFQIEDSTWLAWAPKGGLHMHVWQATFRQQMRGAIEIYRHDGWQPWSADWMCIR